MKPFTFFKLSQIFLALFLLFFGFQIRTLVYSGPFYLTGNFNAYSSFFFYINDIFLSLAFLFWGISYLIKEHKFKLSFGDYFLTLILIVFEIFLVLNVFFAEEKTIHLLQSFRFLELLIFYFLIINKVLDFKKIILFFLIGSAFQALTAIYQYILQSSVGLQFWGEPIANSHTLGMAKIDFGNQKILRSFGTFSHANILGGTMTVSIFITYLRFKKILWVLIPLIILLCLGLLFSFSRSALLALSIGILICFSIYKSKISWRKILLILSLSLFFIIIFRTEKIIFERIFAGDPKSFNERMQYYEISKKMIITNPLGVGLNNYTLQMQNHTDAKLRPWLFQPVHNSFVLAFNELGLIGGGLFTSIFIYIFYVLIKSLKLTTDEEFKKQTTVFLAINASLITIGFFDHYLFSLYPGQILIFLYFGLVSSHFEFINSNKLLPLKKV